jgi:hypothetical protein
MTVTLLDDYRALSAILVPTTVQAAVVLVGAILSSRPTELTVCPVIAVSMRTPVAANTNAELLGSGNTWKAQSYRCQRSTS